MRFLLQLPTETVVRSPPCCFPPQRGYWKMERGCHHWPEHSCEIFLHQVLLRAVRNGNLHHEKGHQAPQPPSPRDPPAETCYWAPSLLQAAPRCKYYKVRTTEPQRPHVLSALMDILASPWRTRSECFPWHCFPKKIILTDEDQEPETLSKSSCLS